ncbi:DUF4870 domain-containing protein [Protaetiibacter larvae]|uniref:DUF4870 domain-containing protein n=1 Tax=Protaetiibacter larvae TaxID=2592654 RepID=A0A5C1Y787_9MICO|nr:DUF4870 domain-containing protein [Protaetiibacter larvae]QEO09804.1 DUF4870 domain-containing protein [Protaetiibacter larvae]
MTDPAQPAPAPQPAAPLTEAEDKQWASFAHLGGILGFLPSLIIWLVFKDRGAKTNVEAKEALNWQITFTIGIVILWIIVGIVSGALLFTGAWFVGSLLGWLPFLWWVLNIVLSILGFVKVNGGGSYRYPFAVRLIK